MTYSVWEEKVITEVADKLGITYSDATGVVGAQSFCMAQSWAKGSDSTVTANDVIAESEK